MTTICLIPGDGVGQEVIPAAARVLATLCPDFTFVEAEAGWECFQKQGTALPQMTLQAVAAADATLFGATQSPSGGAPGYASPILTLRRHFDLYANLRPTRALLPHHPPLDLLLVRENSEGLYSGREYGDEKRAVAERVITRRASARIARLAYSLAQRQHRLSLTLVHKANVLKKSDGLFRRACLEVATQFPQVQTEEMLVDAAAMWLVKNPGHFSTILTSNLFGDILSDLAAGLVGGLGVAASANVGDGQVAVFEPVHGSAPDIAGKGIANPVGALLSAALLLDHVQRPRAARQLRTAVAEVLAAGVLTPDLGGNATTTAVTEAVLQTLTPTPARISIPARAQTPPLKTITGIELLQRLVSIPSLSGQETEAATFLVSWMQAHGFDHAFVDEAGNAVGIKDGGPGAGGTPPRDIVLLGHIDTVPGVVPMRIEEGRLYGRGAVDAKGPLAAFAVAAAKLSPPPGWRLIVIGAVEEEAATSKGARYAAAHYQPHYCIIGEPSGWNRITLGYKGRLLAKLTVRRRMAHTAGPEMTASTEVVALWQAILARIEVLNEGQERAWDQVLPSLRRMASGSDGLEDWATLQLGFRLPPQVSPQALMTLIQEETAEAEVHFRGAEPAFRSDKQNALVRALLTAIRGQGARPGFVLKTGTSDMNVVGPVWQCPIVAYGPGDSRLDHTPNEFVVIDEWLAGVTVLARALEILLTSV